MKLKHPTATSGSVGVDGQEFAIDGKGFVDVPDHKAEHLKQSHGLIDPATIEAETGEDETDEFAGMTAKERKAAIKAKEAAAKEAETGEDKE